MILIDPPLEGISQLSLARFARRAQKLVRVPGEVDVLVTGNRQVRALNRRFRKKDKATDVLSFHRDGGRGGDIAISASIAAANAIRYDHALIEEFKILILHGILHLAGYDHERDNGEMATREKALRARLGLPGSLTERSERHL